MLPGLQQSILSFSADAPTRADAPQYGGAVCVSTETTYDADHTVFVNNKQTTLITAAGQSYSGGAVHLQDGTATKFAVFNAEASVFDSNMAEVREPACERSCWLVLRCCDGCQPPR